MVLPTRFPPINHWSGQGGTSPDRRTHGVTPELQPRKFTVGRKPKDIVSLSCRRIVSYLTSKKANITMRDKTKNPHRAIKDIKYARKLHELFIHKAKTQTGELSTTRCSKKNKTLHQ